jgi:hypothetical protein
MSFPQWEGMEKGAAELLAAVDERMFEARPEGRSRVVAGRETGVAGRIDSKHGYDIRELSRHS